MLKLFNSLTRKLEAFKPLNEKKVGFYSCGPTLYNYPHIGNYRAYVFVDLLKRYLLYSKYAVNHVMNLTDVDDKTIKNSQKEGVSLADFTKRYELAFFDDLKALNILPADSYPKATDYIPEMVDLVNCLLKNGIAYKGTDGSVYYAVSKFKGYGKLAHIDLKKLKTGASGRVNADEYSKDAVNDFALWKAWTKEDGPVFWEYIFEFDVSDEDYKILIEQAIKSNDKEFLELNNIKFEKTDKNEQFPKSLRKS